MFSSAVFFVACRYEKQIQQEEEAFQNERRRLYAEIETEKKRLASQSLREHNEVDRLQQQLQNAHQQLLQTTKEEFDKSLADHEKRHKVNIYLNMTISLSIIFYFIILCLLK